MTDNNSGRPSRTVSRRVFAGELNDSSHTFTESDDERAPNFLLLPTGERANRVFVVGTLTETEDVGDGSEYWQGRVVDPAGDTFFVYAGQYQADAAATLRTLEPPAYVAVVGKTRTYEKDDGDINVSLRPESISVVDAGMRDRWVVETASETFSRISAFEDNESKYASMAEEHHGSDLSEYREAAIEALEAIEDGVGAAGDAEAATEPDADAGHETDATA
ncbi:RPA family protein [Halorussus sp. AFM4]|uniref:RPA family protein n=1 Tax=Halorussus sp. AFM4 TaxID=3421651 RepID=UPI003EB6AF78